MGQARATGQTTGGAAGPPMRVAYISADPGVPVFGKKGCSVHVQEMLRALVRQGATVALFATRFDGEPPTDLRGLRIHALPPVPKGSAAQREQQALAANAALAEALATAGPFDLLYERYSLWSYAGIAHAAAAGVPSVLEVNAPLIQEQATHRELIDRASAERVAGEVFAGATAVVAVSRPVAAYVEGYLGAAGRVHVVPNGVAADRFTPKPIAEGNSDTFVVGFVGSMKPWHGLPVLVEAFARLAADCPDARLLAVGEGPEREQVAADLASRGLSGVATLAGAVPHEDMPAWLARMDVATAPYPPIEPFYFSPLKLYEYMAAGLPVVASAAGDIPETLEDRRTGLLVPPGDPAALAAALRELREAPAFRRRLGAAARRQALAAHSWDRVLERILALCGAWAGPATREPAPQGMH